MYIYDFGEGGTCNQAHVFLQKVTAGLMKLSEGHEASP